MLFLSPARRLFCAAAVALASLAAAAAFAATSLGPDGAELMPTAVVPGRSPLLGPEFMDEANGFRVCTPADVIILERAGIDFMSFVQDAKRWSGAVQAVALQRDLLPDAYLKASRADIEKSLKAVQVLEAKVIKVGSEGEAQQVEGIRMTGGARPRDTRKDASKLVFTYQTEPALPKNAPKNAQPPKPENLLRQDVAVRVGDRQYLLLTMTAPLASKDEAIRTFNAMVETLEVWTADEVMERRLAAVVAGKQWFLNRSPEELAPKLIKQPQYFRIKVEGKDVGYMRFDELEDTYLDYKGIIVQVNSRSFPADGSAILGKNTAFWAYENQPNVNAKIRLSVWSNNVKTVLFPVNGPPQVAWTSETGTVQWEAGQPPLVRDNRGPEVPANGGYVLSVTRSAGKNNVILNEKGQPVPVIGGEAGLTKPARYFIGRGKPDPLPRVLDTLWPRVMDLKEPRRYGFSAFSTTTNGMTLTTLTVHGQEEITIDGRKMKATRVSNELTPGSTTMWVDHTGKILMMATSDKTVLIPTTEEEMIRVWGPKLSKLPAKQGEKDPQMVRSSIAERLFADY